MEHINYAKADKKIVPLDYPSIQKQINELEERMALAKEDDSSIDFDTLLEIQPTLKKLKLELKNNKEEIANTKYLYNDANFAFQYCMENENYEDARQWDIVRKAATFLLSDINESDLANNRQVLNIDAESE